MNPKDWRMSTKLLCGITAALVVAIATTTLVNINQLEALMEERVTTQELPIALDGLKSAVEKELTVPISASRAMARNTYLSRWLRAGEPVEEGAAASEFLTQAKTEFGAVKAFVVGDCSRNYYSEAGLVTTLQPGSDGWYTGFVNSGKPYELVIDVDKDNGRLTAFVNARVTYNGEFLGIAGVGQGVDRLSEIVAGFRIGEEGQVILVDSEGQIAAHPDKTQLGRPLSADLGDKLASQFMQAQRFDYALYHSGDEDYIYATQPIELVPGWRIVAKVPTRELYSGVFAVIQNSTLSSVLVGVVMLGLVMLLVRGIVAPMRQVAQSLQAIGQQGGDLTQRIEIDRNDELGDLVKGFNQFIDKLHDIVSRVVSDNDQLAHALKEVVNNMSTASAQSGEVQHNTDRVAAAVHQMSTTVQEIARNTSEAAEASKDSENAADDGRMILGESVTNINQLATLMEESTQSVNELAHDVERIGAVLEVIHSISEQTNLLALNAAIEAARAGDLGRGFAVVADEVRALAQKTQTSTDEIRQTIDRLQNSAAAAVSKIAEGVEKTQEGVSLSQRAGSALDDIRIKAGGIKDMNIQIAAATEEQSTVTEDININVQKISELATECAYQISACDRECAKIEELGANIRTLMGQFRV